MFAPATHTTLGLASYYVDEAIRRWEPRVTVERVQARLDPADPGRIVVDLRYVLRGTPDTRPDLPLTTTAPLEMHTILFVGSVRGV
ncbi:hypothetical protein DEGR_33480 (plasmid) [Deinococcus grandis]|nr:hypothetical protein DEGR_33480 [Deinococcus grandis]